MGEVVCLAAYKAARKKQADEDRWAEQDRALERYCLGPWLRYGGNLGDGGHRSYYPTMEEQEMGWGRPK